MRPYPAPGSDTGDRLVTGAAPYQPIDVAQPVDQGEGGVLPFRAWTVWSELS